MTRDRRLTRRGAAAFALAFALVGTACGSGPTLDTADVASQDIAPSQPAATTAPTTPALDPAVVTPDAELGDGSTDDAAQQDVTDEATTEPSATTTPATVVAEPDVDTADATPVVTVALPVVDVVNLADGQTASLDTLAAPGATLLWFWAPH